VQNKKDMNIVTPQQMEGDLSKLDEALLKFEQEFKKEEKGQNYYHIVIVGEYDRKVLDEVARQYESAGWSVKACITSSENGERGGLTGLQLERR
jgi:predicted rRNA methylase YqxC with S4 and FtsJ domains